MPTNVCAGSDVVIAIGDDWLKPTAEHDETVTHDASHSDELAPAGGGGNMLSVQVDPINVSYSAVAPSLPTARQMVGPAQETFESTESVWGRLGGLVGVHDDPVKVSPSKPNGPLYPTATQEVDEKHETELSAAPGANEGVNGVQVEPLKVSMSAELPSPPTAMHELGDVHDTLDKTELTDWTGTGVGIDVQVDPESVAM